ncbi:hypothetical protein [Thermococcus henrietii]|uniref:hypothetical protein n=1 Tax=Thermococcus henrietii TaxID=2016361 RepID=UPI000C076C67|nr:hypothetical protein [Thermococcus henrietii]
MGKFPKIASAVLLTFLALFTVVSALQWWAYESAKERILSLPCDPELTPYRLEAESFLPPGWLLKEGIGYRYGFSGELELVVPEKLGKPSPEYEDLLWVLGLYLNDSVSDLRGFLANGSDEEIRMAFQPVERNYIALKLAREYGERNLTEVVLRPSPPLAWVLEVWKGIRKFASLPETKIALVPALFTLLSFTTLYLWLAVLAKTRNRVGKVKAVISFLLLSLIFAAALWGVLQVFEPFSVGMGNPTDRERGAACMEFPSWKYTNTIHSKASEYIDSHPKATCEVLKYLDRRLGREDMEKLVGALSLNWNCPGLSF